MDTRQVDQTGLKTGQALTIVLLLLGFVLNAPVLIALVAVAQLLGAMGAAFAPYRLVYRYAIKPSGMVKPNVIHDNPEPHRFAMLVGGVMNTLAVFLLISGANVAAWVLVWIVIALANLNFWAGFCLGCWFYYRLNRLGVPGFSHAPITD